MSQTVETRIESSCHGRVGIHPPGLYALFTTEMWERFGYTACEPSWCCT